VNNNSDAGVNYKFEHFFELSADLFCIAGFDGFFKKINPAVSKTLGYTMEELFSRPINDFVHPDDQNITERVREEIRNNKPLLNFENRYLTKEGDTIWLSWTSMPVFEEKLVFAIAKNITHKVRLEEERNLLLANLTKINQELTQFAYTTSHDLRSPLGSLISATSLFNSEIYDEPTLELIDILKRGSRQLRDTLNNHLDVLSQKNSLYVPLEDLDLKEVLHYVLQSINSLVQNANVVFEVDFSEVEKIKFNKTYLESIFLNLITNSIKYSKPGISPIITMSSKKISGKKQLIIADNGLGFDMEKVKDKIFGLHQKFHNHSDSKGIGLYLVYNHITSLGGSIEVESQINQGARFIISLKD